MKIKTDYPIMTAEALQEIAPPLTGSHAAMSNENGFHPQKNGFHPNGNGAYDHSAHQVSGDLPVYIGSDRLFSPNFTPGGVASINGMIERTKDGDKEAQSRFIGTIEPWMKQKSAYWKEQALTALPVSGKSREWAEPELSDTLPVREIQERFDDATLDVLSQMLESVRSGRTKDWTRFANAFQEKLKMSFANILSEAEKQDGPVHIPITRRIRKIPSGTQAGQQADAVELARTLRGKMRTLEPREYMALQERFFEGREREEVALDFEVSPERVRQIEKEALRKMRLLLRSKALQPWQEGKMPDQGVVAGNRHDRVIAPLVATIKELKYVMCEALGLEDEKNAAAIAKRILERTHLSEKALCALMKSEDPVIDKNLLDVLKYENIVALHDYVAEDKKERFDSAAITLSILMSRFRKNGGEIAPTDWTGRWR